MLLKGLKEEKETSGKNNNIFQTILEKIDHKNLRLDQNQIVLDIQNALKKPLHLLKKLTELPS